MSKPQEQFTTDRIRIALGAIRHICQQKDWVAAEVDLHVDCATDDPWTEEVCVFFRRRKAKFEDTTYGDTKFAHIKGNSIEQALEKAKDWIEKQPSILEAERAAFAAKLRQMAEIAQEDYGLEIGSVESILAAAEALASNAITDQETEAF